ncbi:MAG: LysM peptidoglycan-binding domain-containing protein, partial [Candidatus Parcubacteria bacterium]|nr:LysM peptidoglycan-binding domain-containing protein [Candidatus Parcubacteria bacterium]
MAITSAAVFLPNHASAFWPFSTNADAAMPALVPSSSTPILRAPINRNPNSSAPIALATSGGSALISYNGPGGTIAENANDVPPDRISVYEVKQYDTLLDIAHMFGDISVNTIIWANDLSGPKDIHPGDM